MNILIVTPHYLPDLGPSAPLFSMLCNELVAQGHNVTVTTAVPHYPTGYVRKEFAGKFLRRTVEAGVNITRVGIPSTDRSNLFKRSLQFVCFQIGAALACMGERKYDVAFFSNPALWVWLPYVVCSCIHKKPVIFSIYDLYPDVGIQLGIFRNKFCIAVITWLEKFCLKRASSVRIITKSFIPAMHAFDVPDDKLVLLYDWVDTDLVRPGPSANDFSRENGLENKFVVLYAGNIGLSQGLEHVLTSAEQLSGHKDILFVFVGEGAAREDLITLAEIKQLPNVKFIPFQPRERLPEVLASADVSLVPLRKGVGTSALPSKTFSIFASGRPIIASVDEGCETWDLISDSKSGICIKPESPHDLSNAILHLKQNPELRGQMGCNGRLQAEKHHSPQSAAKRIEQLALQIVGAE